MKRLWIADVHANLPALEAVLADAGAVDEVVFLGDIVGYGPHPAECIGLLMGLQPQAVLGNHDAAVLALRGSAEAWAGPLNWDAWTAAQLGEGQLDWLVALPNSLTLSVCGQSALARHHVPGAPYLHPAMPDEVMAAHVGELPAPLVLVGHSHRALDRTLPGHRLVCLPPVGQPRNGDPRAGYAIEEVGALAFHYAAYDVERTARDTQRIGLPEPFCRRWLTFLRTARDPEWSREYASSDARRETL